MQRPWTAEESLCDQTLFADWDGVASMIFSLRTYLFEHGTVPTWNFMFCGGHPELSVPFSWAYAWPSLFGYVLPPIHAILAVWIVMSLAGFLAMRALLMRWSGVPCGATAGACVYVLSGYFASHFNAGHITFAFFHFVPILILLFEVGFARLLAGRTALGPSLLGTLCAYLFFSGGLPHAPMYFYPALILLAVFRVIAAATSHGGGAALRAAATPLASQMLGLWLAAYRIWPAIRWQLDSPRKGVRLESYQPSEIVRNTLTFTSDLVGAQQPWYVYPPWSYDAFMGPMPWLLGLLVVFGLVRRIRKRSAEASGSDAVAPCFALALIGIGFALSLGNGNPVRHCYIFQDIPLFDGIRVFSRYQILIVMGLSALVALGFAEIFGHTRSTRTRRATFFVVWISTVAPVVVHASLLVWNVRAAPRAQIFHSHYDITDRANPPRIVTMRKASLYEAQHQWSLLERGYWIANCHSDLTLARLEVQPPIGRWRALSSPPPTRLLRLGRNTLTLDYSENSEETIVLNLRLLKSFGFNAPLHTTDDGHVFFRRGELTGGKLTIRAQYPGPSQGFWASSAGLAASLVFFVALARSNASLANSRES